MTEKEKIKQYISEIIILNNKIKNKENLDLSTIYKITKIKHKLEKIIEELLYKEEDHIGVYPYVTIKLEVPDLTDLYMCFERIGSGLGKFEKHVTCLEDIEDGISNFLNSDHLKGLLTVN